MGTELTKIQDLLHDPNYSSSLLPLLVVTTILFLATLIGLYKLYSLFRVPKTSLPKGSANSADGKVQWREWIRYIFIYGPSRKPATSSQEVDALRAQLRKLEQANKLVREQYARAMARIGELQGELKNLIQKREEEEKLVDLERQRSLRLEENIEKLESKLQDAMRETERIFQQNASLARPGTGIVLPAKPTPVSEILKDFPPPPDDEK